VILSASWRTDIPAFYGRWFLARLAAGWVEVANPYGGPTSRIDLNPASIRAVVFWTRNPAPFDAGLAACRARTWPFVVQMSVTGLPRAIERSAPAPESAVQMLRDLARQYGPKAAVWRFDPILVSTATPPAERRETFARLAKSLAGAVDEVVVSFAQPYAKTRRNLAGLDWRDPPIDEKQTLLRDLASIAAEQGMALTLCTQPSLVDDTADLVAARCIDTARLSEVAGRAIEAPERGNRPGCRCAASRDIGAYDSCAMGCGYCYAVRTRERAQARLAAHDPDSPRL